MGIKKITSAVAGTGWVWYTYEKLWKRSGIMNTWWICFIPLMILLIVLAQQRKETNKYIEARIRRRKGDPEMQKLAERFIGKDVMINTVASGTYDGILKEIVDNAVVLEKDGKETIVNLDYVIRLREYPKNKHGKRKSLITD